MTGPHRPREAPRDPDDPNRRECQICGVEVIGFGPTLKHKGEEVPTIPVPREYMHALNDCVSLVEQALSQVTERATDSERARAAVVALIDARYLRTKRGGPVRTPPGR